MCARGGCLERFMGRVTWDVPSAWEAIVFAAVEGTRIFPKNFAVQEKKRRGNDSARFNDGAMITSC